VTGDKKRPVRNAFQVIRHSSPVGSMDGQTATAKMRSEGEKTHNCNLNVSDL